MSVQAMSWVIAHSPHKGSALLCLLMVANHAHADGTGAFPSVPTLAAECRMSARQIIRLLQHLEASGALRVQHRAGPRGARLMAVVMDATAPLVGATPDILSGQTPDSLSPDILSPLTFCPPTHDIAVSPEPSIEPSMTHSPTESEAPDAGAPDAPSPAQLALKLPKAQTTDAVRAFNAIIGKRTNPTERAAINEAVPATPKAQALWESVLRVWKLRYDRNKSCEGPLEWFAAGGPPPKRVAGNNGASGTGGYVQPNTQKRNDNPEAALPAWTPEQAAASDAARERTRELMKRAARIGGGA